MVQRVLETKVTWTTTTKTDTEPLPPALAATKPPTRFTLGHIMDADPLTAHAGGLVASKPQGRSEWWPYFQVRHQPQHHVSSPLYWVQGHLLNDNLHGPGEPDNLVPLSNTTNTNMETSGERAVKEAVKAGKVLHYRVEAVWEKEPADRRRSYGLKEENGSLIWGEQFAPTGVRWTATEKQEQPAGSGKWVDARPLPQPEFSWYNTFPQPVTPIRPPAAPSTARITLSPFKMSGAGGGLTVSGRGFTPNGTVKITYLNVPGHDEPPLQTVDVDAGGAFACRTTFNRAPANTDPQTVVMIYATDIAAGWATEAKLPVMSLWV